MNTEKTEKVMASATKNTETNQDAVTYDDLLTAAGELGRYQWLLFFASFPFYAFGVCVYFSQMFITEVSPNHWCRIPELENFTDIQRRDIGIPKDENSRFGYSRCTMYDVNWTSVLVNETKSNRNWTTVTCQHGWEFNKTEIPYPTFGSDFEWVCDKNSYQATAQAVFFIGAICGGLLFGWISDRFGRIPATTLSCLTGCLGGFVSTFTYDLPSFAAARFVVGMAFDTCMMTVFLLVLEYIAPKYRTMVAHLTFATFFCLFSTLIPWLALACGHWKTICLVTSVPLVLAAFTKFLLPESPMWLISKGRIDEAVEKVLVIGKVNKKVIPMKKIENFKSSMQSGTQEENGSILEILRRPLLRKVFILVCLEYMCCSIIFDALLRYTGQIEFNFFASFSMIACTEFPSVLLLAFVMDHIGRRWTNMIFMASNAVFCILIMFASGVQTVIFAISARFCINVGFSAIIQWASEVLPTPVRGKGVAIVNISGFLAMFLSPYIMYLKEFIDWLPLTVLAGVGMLGVSIAFVLPETARKPMPHSFEDAENLSKNQNLWTLPYFEMRKMKNIQKGQINEGFQNEVSTAC